MAASDVSVANRGGTAALRPGALGMATSLILAVASAAPAYGLAATLALIVAYVGFQAPAIVIVAFIPILFISFGYAALNRRDPDCGTIFVWATKTLSPRIGFMGGWAIIASFILVMGSLAQVAGQYVFILFGADGIGSDPANPWVLLVGLGWIALMTTVCYRGIEVAAAVQRGLLALEVVMLAAFSVVALVKVYAGHTPGTGIRPSVSWLDPFQIGSASAFVNGVVLMLFLYWGWETSLTVTEETVDPHRTPGRSAMGSTVLLLALYLMATVAALAFAGIGENRIGLGTPDNFGDIFSALGGAVFGTTGIGSVMFHLLILMVLTSAAASTETTVLTLGRTMLSMGRMGALPKAFGSISPRFRVPKVGTIATGAAGATVYVIMNFVSHGQVIADAVSSCAVMIAFYYGLTGLTSAWAYRAQWRNSPTDMWMRVILPAIGGLTLVAAGAWFLKTHWDPANSMTSWTIPIPPHWHVGGVFVIGVGALLLGALVMFGYSRMAPAFFDGEPTALETDVERKREMA